MALHYGARPPWAELAAFDWVVLEPGQSAAQVVALSGRGETRPAGAAGAGAPAPRAGGRVTDASATRAAYVDRVLSFVDTAALRPLHILVNCGNGAAGPTFDAIATALAARAAPLRFTRMHHDPDGGFPNGIPNPLLPENQPVTAAAVVAHGADMGVAFDGDFDRCFFFDGTGRFVPGEYVVGLLAETFLAKAPEYLSANGGLTIVANAFLRYQPILDTHFKRTEVVNSDSKFKVYLSKV